MYSRSIQDTGRLTHKCEKPTTLFKNGRWHPQKRKKILKTSLLGVSEPREIWLGEADATHGHAH